MNKHKLYSRLIWVVVWTYVGWAGFINFMSFACEERAQRITWSISQLKQIEDKQIKTVFFIKCYMEYQNCRGDYAMVSSLNYFWVSKIVWDGYFESEDLLMDIYTVIYY